DASSSAYPPTMSFNQTSQLLGYAADSATAPVYTWSGDTNTGMFSPAADVVGFTTNGTERLRIDPNGNVGIGTTTPTQKLTIGAGGSVRLQDTANAYTNLLNARIWASNFRSGTVLDSNGSINFGLSGVRASGFAFRWLSSDNSAIDYSVDTSELMRLTMNGNLGIGTTTPGAKLEVHGNLKLSSGTGASIVFSDGTTQSTAYTGISCGGDYAESVDVASDRRSYEPGDVLVIDIAHPGSFLRSTEPYSTSVAGVYSTKPGYVGRRQTTPKSEDEIPMAMIGIVPTKVTTENGAIHVGDLLVTSSQAGYAMKGTDRGRMMGAVVGKALGNLESGTGLIEVLVTLQ